MTSHMRLFLFGEDASDILSRVQDQVIESRTDPFLGLFFERTSKALRTEIARLPPPQRACIPVFTTIGELNDKSTSHLPHSGVQNALLCTSQIAYYIK